MRTEELMISILEESKENDVIKMIVPILLSTLGEWVDANHFKPLLGSESYVIPVEDEEADYEEKLWNVWKSNEVIVKTSKSIVKTEHWSKWVKQEDGTTDSFWSEELRDDKITSWWKPFEEEFETEEVKID